MGLHFFVSAYEKLLNVIFNDLVLFWMGVRNHWFPLEFAVPT